MSTSRRATRKNCSSSIVIRLAAVIAIALAVAVPATAQVPAPRFPVTGTVQDQTGGMLPGAEVTLTGGPDAAPRVTKTTDAGLFRFDDVPAGAYDLRAHFEGFNPAATRMRVGPRAPGRQKLVLKIAGLNQEVTVGTESTSLTLDASRNRDGVTVDRKMLADIPVFDRDVVAAVAALLDPGAAGTGGTTLVVDGMEGRKVGVPASAIQEIKINQDPY